MSRTKKNPFTSKPVYAIVVDGDCESWYMSMIKRNEQSIKVDIKPEIPQKKKLKDQYERVLELSRYYDKVIWIVDFDVINNETLKAKRGANTPLNEFKSYLGALKSLDTVSVIVNVPCLEYWFLLHFEMTSKYFSNCEDANKQLKKHLKDYEKSQKYFTNKNNDIYLKLKDRLNTAFEHAEKLEAFDINNPYKGVTQMQILFELLGLKEAT
ncbi:RloB family protein [Niastella populi]|uniref:RloB-like protein n=1 Tax=Niastella populi TaxID=550983 RepID=A0A1V9FEQ2_9BACT|nr:RloB family protein [Niastella populi]OQP56696.1 hypothetical protein A4R26_25425 [Niastella populi]